MDTHKDKVFALYTLSKGRKIPFTKWEVGSFYITISYTTAAF